jgi:hypothetical protein
MHIVALTDTLGFTTYINFEHVLLFERDPGKDYTTVVFTTSHLKDEHEIEYTVTQTPEQIMQLLHPGPKPTGFISRLLTRLF